MKVVSEDDEELRAEKLAKLRESALEQVAEGKIVKDHEALECFPNRFDELEKHIKGLQESRK